MPSSRPPRAASPRDSPRSHASRPPGPRDRSVGRLIAGPRSRRRTPCTDACDDAPGDSATRSISAMPAPLVVSDMDGTLATVDTWRGVHAWILANHRSRDAERFVRGRLPSIVMARVFGRDPEGFRARWQEDQLRLLTGLGASRIDDLAAFVVDEHL